MTDIRRAAIYVRVSTTRQAEADLSIPDQLKQLREYCARRGWPVVDEFKEPGASAMNEDRPAFQDLIGKATGPNRPYDVVVVHSLSRFSRDLMHSEIYVRKLHRVGVELVSITQELGQDGQGDFIRKIISAFDEHQSRENAKHTHRAMLENARQGFWNGSAPPFGYATIVRERRGNKDKKVLVVNEDEARIVRMIFDLYLGEDGPPMGLKAIVNHCNKRGFTRRGHRYGTGSVQDLLTTSTYCGKHYFNRTDSRNKKKRPQSEWIEMAVPAIVDEDTFNRTQLMLRSRSPRRTPPRVVNGPTMLAGVARCGHCGAAMIQNTGKGGLYRYYCCSRKMKQGATACRGQRIRMDELDKLVLDYLSGQLFTPARLSQLLASFVSEAGQNAQARKEKLRQAREARGDLDAGLTRLLVLVERGHMQPDDPTLAERMEQIRLQKAELDREIGRLQQSLKLGTPTLTPDRLAALSVAMRKRLLDGPPELRQAYMRVILQSVTVEADEIRLEGPPAALERLAQTGPSSSLPEVLSFAQEWRPREEEPFR